MKRTLIAMVAALGLASSASAATLSLDTDAATYNVSDTITVTMTLTTDGSEATTAIFAQVAWDGAIGVGAANSSQSGNLTSFSGGLAWTPGGGLCATADSCTMIDQLQGLTSFPADPGQVITATLEIHAAAVGALNLGVIAGTFNVIGLTAGDTQVGANAAAATVVPEPGTAAMVGLGLLGLASVGRRRN